MKKIIKRAKSYVRSNTYYKYYYNHTLLSNPYKKTVLENNKIKYK